MQACWWISMILPLFFNQVCGQASSRDVNDKKYRLVCYWDTGSISRKGDGQFLVENIDASLCTHLVVRSARLIDGTSLGFDSDLQSDDLHHLFELRQNYPHLMILLSLDDLSDHTSSESYLTYDDFGTFQDALLKGVDRLLAAYDFDGIDLDISNPDIYGKSPDIHLNIVSLLQYLRKSLDNSGRLLTALVSGDKTVVDYAYDIASIDKIVDFTSLKTFDYHSGAEKVTGLNAPLYARPDEQGDDRHLNADWSVSYWLTNGGSPEKTVMGVASFGRTFTLKDAGSHDVGSPVSGYGKAGPYLLKAGLKGYNEICDVVANNGWTVDWEPHQESPYAYMDNQWVGYDDVGSVEIKGKYTNTKGLSGAMLWNMDTDDFLGNCGVDKYPLLKELKIALDEGGDRPVPPGPTENPFEPVCREEGYFRNPLDCRKFYRCVQQGHKLTLFDFDCGPGTVFDETTSNCNWPASVRGCENYA